NGRSESALQKIRPPLRRNEDAQHHSGNGRRLPLLVEIVDSEELSPVTTQGQTPNLLPGRSVQTHRHECRLREDTPQQRRDAAPGEDDPGGTHRDDAVDLAAPAWPDRTLFSADDVGAG